MNNIIKLNNGKCGFTDNECVRAELKSYTIEDSERNLHIRLRGPKNISSMDVVAVFELNPNVDFIAIFFEEINGPFIYYHRDDMKVSAGPKFPRKRLSPGEKTAIKRNTEK